MPQQRNPIGKIIEALKEGLSDVMDQLAPEPDRIPIPVSDEPRRRR